jgi:hypothetical protein
MCAGGTEGQASLTPGSGGSRGGRGPMDMCSPGGLLPSVGSMSSSQPSLMSPPPEVWRPPACAVPFPRLLWHPG